MSSAKIVSNTDNEVKAKSLELAQNMSEPSVPKVKKFNLFGDVVARGNDVKKAFVTKANEVVHPKIPVSERIRKFFSRETVLKLQEEGRTIMSLASFFGLVLIFLVDLTIRLLANIPGIKQLLTAIGNKTGHHVWRLSETLINRFESRPGRIRRSVLINLAFRNMRVKRTRAMVTVGGMGLGIGAIVFLVSLGYGVQRLVVSRVARLDELRMADVTLQNSSNLRLDNNAITSMQNMSGVAKVMPMVSLVGKLTFSGGQGESLVYGVSKEYLEAAGIKPTQGEFFESSDEAAMTQMQGTVAGVSDGIAYLHPSKVGTVIKEGRYELGSSVYSVYQEPWINATELGMTRAIAGGIWGSEVWGESYGGGMKGKFEITYTNEKRGVWLASSYPIWEKVKGKLVPKLDETGAQVWSRGYIKMLDSVSGESEAKVGETRIGSVLGESSVVEAPYTVLGETEEASIAATVVGVDEAGVEWVDLTSLDATEAAKPEIMIIETPGSARKQAMVNTPFMELVGIDKNNPVGATFEISFVILNTLKPDLDRPAQSAKATYTVSGIIDEGTSPQMYVPLEDLTGLGITNFSQAKVVAGKQDELSAVRQQIDNLGYKTTSVADTVEQIDKLFATVRIVLASFGLVALTVASLGMFNTLTVSLMERTREVGVMKAMGMRSVEVKELFLAEAMIMGLLGGVFGVLAGWGMGKILGLLLSTISIARGVGAIDV
ncbi:MAG: ABC transporter permease, partial [Thiothrix sp.]